MITKEDIQLIFKEKREVLGLTADEMARMLKVSEKTINEWENCTKIINSIDVLNVLLAYRCMPVDIIHYLRFAEQYSSLKYQHKFE